MIITGAVIKEQGVTFAIVSVKPYILRYTATAVQARRNFSAFFPNMPIILMAQTPEGAPRYVGRKDIVDFLNTIRINQIPWKQYKVY